jgi:hypothetical protein
MKKKLLITIALLFLLLGGALLGASFLIETQKVQEQILSRINSWYVVEARVQDVRFRWFPFPHVEIKQLEIRHQDFSVTTPQATLSPSWKILVGVFSWGRLDIIDPVVEVQAISLTASPVAATPLSLPNIKIHIKNGTLSMPARQNSVGAMQPISLSRITADLAVHDQRGDFSWQSTASFADSIECSGEFGSQDKQIALIGETKGFQALKILTADPDKLLAPLADSSTFSFLVKKGRHGLTLSLQGDIPDFALNRLAGPEAFRLGKGDLDLHLGPRDTFSLLINDLLFQEPALQIKGEIARHFPVDADQPHIKIDLRGQDIDLSAVRHKVLALVGDNPVAILVGDIVQGGRAHSASYFFDAPTPAFEDVTAMTIQVDIATADIHLAAIPLDLHNAQGPIVIKDGNLTGENITTWVGDAKGTKGVFLVGLAHDKFGLQVDVDIDANLEELPGVLMGLLDHEDVVRELGLVQGSGRATGHLHIGDHLHDFQVRVDVDRYHDAELRYERLSWPLRPESGSLQVTGTSVTWKNIKAQMASHAILESSGQANWQDPATPLAVESLHALFDANALLGELQQYPSITKALAGVITAIQGSVEVTGSLQGPFFRPSDYTYSLATRLQDITLTTPALSEKVLIGKAQATIDQQDVDIASVSATLLGRPIQLKGTLRHDHGRAWQGNLMLNGVLGNRHLRWLHSREMLPEFLVPRPPLKASDLSLRWNEQLFGLTGKFLSSDEQTTLQLDILTQDRSFSGLFKVKNGQDKASYALQWQDGGASFASAFKGTLSGATLASLLTVGTTRFESMHGDFKVQKTTEPATTLAFNGDLRAESIQWSWGKEKRAVAIPILDLNAHDDLLTIKALETTFNDETISATGTFASEPGAGHLELDIKTAQPLTSTTLEKFQEDLDHFLSSTLKMAEVPKELAHYQLSGLLNFDLNGLVLPFGGLGNNGAQSGYNLPFTPLKGSYRFSTTDSELNLHESMVCGVQVDGQLTWRGPQETSKKISLTTPNQVPLRFKDFLSCFNFEEVIDGPLQISGRIESDTEICRLGGLLITSEKGSIKKFVALAKTLSLINITGLSGAIWKDGFYYKTLEVSGNICDNIFTIDKAYINGDGVDVVATGEINLTTMEYDLTFFVVPFSTISGLVTKVPLVGRVLGGKGGRIISVPVKVTGPLTDPTITVLSPSAIGEATATWILDTITLPFGWMIPADGDTPAAPPAQKDSPPSHPATP